METWWLMVGNWNITMEPLLFFMKQMWFHEIWRSVFVVIHKDCTEKVVGNYKLNGDESCIWIEFQEFHIIMVNSRQIVHKRTILEAMWSYQTVYKMQKHAGICRDLQQHVPIQKTLLGCKIPFESWIITWGCIPLGKWVHLVELSPLSPLSWTIPNESTCGLSPIVVILC